MTLASKSLLILATALLLHSGYSAYEFSEFKKHVVAIDRDLPLDAIVGVLLVCIGTAVGAIGTLKPISFPKAVSELESTGKNPYSNLERRPIFIDVVAKRKEYTEWRKLV